MEELDIEGLMDMLSRMKGKDADARGVDTPAQRDGVMDTLKPINVMKSNNYDFDVDGKTEGYTFTGDAAPSSASIQRMRELQNITADGGMKPNLGLGSDTVLRGLGPRGFETPALRDAFMGQSNPELMPGKTPTIPDVVPTGFHRMPDGTVMADGSMDYAGTGEMSSSPQTVDRTKFNSQFADLSSTEQDRVKELMSGMTDEQKAIFGAGLTGSPLSGYAVQDENYGSY